VYNLVDIDLVMEETPIWDFDEASDLVYGITKAEAEREVMKAMAEGLPAVIMRPPNILGAHPRGDSTHYAQAIKEGKPSYGGEGGNTWPYVVVENLVEAIVLAIHTPQAMGRVYTIVDGHTTWREHIGIFADWLGVELKQRPLRAPYDFFRGRFSTGRIKNELGYSPRLTYEESMARTKEFLQEIGLLSE
jgi:nucleoside-diphosphate-sugar epimerase